MRVFYAPLHGSLQPCLLRILLLLLKRDLVKDENSMTRSQVWFQASMVLKIASDRVLDFVQEAALGSSTFNTQLDRPSCQNMGNQ